MDTMRPTLPSRARLISAVCAALIFAIPLVTFISCMVVFPIAIYAAIAVFVNVGFLFLPLVLGASQGRWTVAKEQLWHRWILLTIFWFGCSIGFANWGSAASSMGARNQPFLEVFFAPIVMALRYLT